MSVATLTALAAGISVLTGIVTAVSVVVINRTDIGWIKKIINNHETRIEKLEDKVCRRVAQNPGS